MQWSVTTLRVGSAVAIIGTSIFWVVDTLGRSPLFGDFLTDWLFPGDRDQDYRTGWQLSFVRGVLREGAIVLFLLAFLGFIREVRFLKLLRWPALLAACSMFVVLTGQHLVLFAFSERYETTWYSWTVLVVQTVGTVGLVTFFGAAFFRARVTGERSAKDPNRSLFVVTCAATAATLVVTVVDCLPLVAQVSAVQVLENIARALECVGFLTFFASIFLSRAGRADAYAAD